MQWSEELSSGLLQAAPDAILVMDEGYLVLVNDRAVEVFGWPRGELLGQRADVLLVDTERVPALADLRRDADQRSSGTSRMGTVALRVRRRDGTSFPAEASLSRVQTPQGRVTVAVIRDMTEGQRLRAEAERQRSEVQEHRNQRLEALGQLAGGIAHDFNNMLGVIVNYANFVIEEAESEAPDVSMIAADARQVVRAGQRGTNLTHQLLAFARREVVRPQVLDLNAAIFAVEEMLRRSLGEHINLQIGRAHA